MRCSRARKLLSPFMDGELSVKEAHKVRDHVTHCENCREELGQIEHLDALSRTVLPQESSEAYWANFLPRLHQKIHAAPSRSIWAKVTESMREVLLPTSPWLRTAGAVASVILVFVIGWALLRDTGTHDLLIVPSEHRMGKKMDQETPAEEIGQAQEQLDMVETGEEEDIPPALAYEDEFVVQPVEEKDRMTQPLKEERLADRGVASRMEHKRTVEGEKTAVTTEPSAGLYSAVSTDETRWLYEQALQQQSTGENEAAAAQYRYILDNHPQSQQADDAQFQLNVIKGSTAEEQQTLESWQHQRDGWQQFLQTYPESELSDQACLKLAESWYHIASVTLKQEDVQKALTVNRQCQQAWKDETGLKKQNIELQNMLNKSRE